MICIDTTVLIDEFRARGNPHTPINRFLKKYVAESMIVPACVAGEFLDGAATVSEKRIQQALQILRTRNIASISLETAEHYGRIASELRKQKLLGGRSQNDIWIAATALQHGARLLTRNPKDFKMISGLEVLPYNFNM